MANPPARGSSRSCFPAQNQSTSQMPSGGTAATCSRPSTSATRSTKRLYRHLTDQPATPRPDLGSIKKLPPKPRPQPSPSPLPPAATARLDVFDEQHLADVREACKEGLKKLTDKRMKCEDDKRERTILQSLGRELDIDSKKSEHQLVESITNSMIEPGDDETIGKLVNVHEQLCLQNKLDEASVIAEIVDLVLPLCFPRDVISRAWQQLQDHEAVLIEGAVVTKTPRRLSWRASPRKARALATSLSQARRSPDRWEESDPARTSGNRRS